MRDFLLNEALKRLATEAATRLSTLVASGDQIPFDVAADTGDDSAFYSYVPLTARFVEQHAGELRSLPSFGPAREAAIEAGVAAPYLEARGEPVPADPGERAELMLTVFIAALWEGSTEFSLDRARLESALSTLDAEARDADDADVLSCRWSACGCRCQRLQLPHGVRIVRADSIEAPIEAMRSEGMGRAAWEPQFLAVAEQDDEGGAEGALHQLRELISVMQALQGRRRRPRPLRLRARPARAAGGGSPPAPRRPGPAATGSARTRRASWPSSPARWRRAPTPTAPWPGRSAASRWAASARARSRASATTCWRCARCSRATARSAPRCRCAPRR